jgi:hypothetical protein
MVVANTLAYYDMATITVVISLIVQAPRSMYNQKKAKSKSFLNEQQIIL